LSLSGGSEAHQKELEDRPELFREPLRWRWSRLLAGAKPLVLCVARRVFLAAMIHLPTGRRWLMGRNDVQAARGGVCPHRARSESAARFRERS